MSPQHRPSPNHGPRHGVDAPDLVVLHYTAMASAEAALDRLCDPGAEVSAHYLIAGDGTIWHLVDEDQRAWHAGAGSWAGQGDVNSRSIGIELDNTGSHPFSEPQMAALETLLAELRARWPIAPAGVIGHSDMAPGRKCDPGPRFDWARLERRGLAARPRATGPAPETTPAAFRRLATLAGYPDVAPDAALLDAVRLRLRPAATGPLCEADLRALLGG